MTLSSPVTTQTPPVNVDVTTWGVSKDAISILEQIPEIVEELAYQRTLPPMPPGYIPSVIDILFDDVPYIRAVDGVLTYTRDCLPDYQPTFVEYRFDNEIALFQIGNEYIVNRITGIAQVFDSLQQPEE